MPNKTFLNLETSKREKVQKALVSEFTRVPLEECSIKNIVNEAEIPRGSFYQYFADKEDALRFMISMTQQMGEQEIHKNLSEEIEDVYGLVLHLYKYEVKSFEKSGMTLRAKLLEQIGKSQRAINIFNDVISHKAVNNPRFRKFWIKAGLDKLSAHQEKAALELLTSSMREALYNILQGNVSTTGGLSSLTFKLNIIKAGLEQELKNRSY